MAAEVASNTMYWLCPVSSFDFPANLVGMSGDKMLTICLGSIVAGVLSFPIQVERSLNSFPVEKEIGVAWKIT